MELVRGDEVAELAKTKRQLICRFTRRASDNLAVVVALQGDRLATRGVWARGAKCDLVLGDASRPSVNKPGIVPIGRRTTSAIASATQNQYRSPFFSKRASSPDTANAIPQYIAASADPISGMPQLAGSDASPATASATITSAQAPATNAPNHCRRIVHASVELLGIFTMSGVDTLTG